MHAHRLQSARVGRDALGDGPGSDIPAALVLERFAVATNGDALLVPVRLADTDHLFLVDTGATTTCLDTSLPLGHPWDTVTAGGSDEDVELKLYRPPAARIGRTALGPLDAVAGMDLNPLRQATGHPIEGILGMDFLGRYVVHIDVANGELLLLKAAPKGPWVELPISWQPGDSPFVVADVGPGEHIQFLIDTGDLGLDSGSLGVSEAHSLVKTGQFREIGKTSLESISGTRSRLLIRGQGVNIGGFVVQSPIFSESHGPRPNVLGLRFWSRFAATFDFPNRKLYLRKSADFSRPDRFNSTGLHLWKRGKSIEVYDVDPNSPAAHAGLKKGDLIVELNGLCT